MMAALESFVMESDVAGIDLQFFCGEEAGSDSHCRQC